MDSGAHPTHSGRARFGRIRSAHGADAVAPGAPPYRRCIAPGCGGRATRQGAVHAVGRQRRRRLRCDGCGRAWLQVECVDT